jgi:hypothetical protein
MIKTLTGTRAATSSKDGRIEAGMTGTRAMESMITIIGRTTTIRRVTGIIE